MVSYFDLLIIFLIAVCFVALFKLQKKFTPTKYFANSQLIVGESVSWRMILIRFLLVFLFGMLSNTIIKEEVVILLGVILGSFLIIWPTILSPSESYMYTVKKSDIFFIYLSNFLFVITSVSIVFIAIKLFPMISGYVTDNKADLLWDISIWFIIAIFGFPGKEKVDRLLEKRLRNNVDYYYLDDDSEKNKEIDQNVKSEISATREE